MLDTIRSQHQHLSLQRDEQRAIQPLRKGTGIRHRHPAAAPREKGPTFTVASASMETRSTAGLASAAVLTALSCAKMASISGTFFWGGVLATRAGA